MSQSRAEPGTPPHEDPGLVVAARARLDAVLAGFNRLSPDELARVGLSRHDPSDHPIRRVAIAFLAIEAILFGIVAFVSDGTRGDALVALLTGALFTLAVVRRSRQPRIPDDARPMRGAP